MVQLHATFSFSNSPKFSGSSPKRPRFSPTSSGLSPKRHRFGVAYLRANLLGTNLTFNCKANGGELDPLPHLQTLGTFPREELAAKVVLVRFDSALLLHEHVEQHRFQSDAVLTIKYLCQSGARVVLASDWSVKTNPKLCVAQSVADFLSSLVDYKVAPVSNLASKVEGFEKGDIVLLENLSEFRGEVANCSKFAQVLSSGVDIFVNDYFSRSHKMLASTCGVARFCYGNLAGFHFEKSLSQLRRAAETDTKPYVAIIGGGNLSDKAAALHSLASICDGLVFVGMMSFQIIHALGISVPLNFLEHGALKEALDIVQVAHDRNVQILYPKDFWCKNDSLPKQLEIFPAHGIPDGWVPIDIGPVSLVEINSMLTKCKVLYLSTTSSKLNIALETVFSLSTPKVTWIGPVKFRMSNCTKGASILAQMLNQLSQSNCSVTVVGSMACEAMVKESNSVSHLTMIENASVVWEFLKGRKLPGVMALDRAYPFDIDWIAAYSDPAQPLVVDIGSGNGMFLFGMAKIRKDLNFLGLEMNKKSGIRNGYFIATNATSTFRSIISSYPGKLVLVSIQCPNPDFSEPEHRWSMLQRSLVEAISDLLTANGKVFLQSDIETVSVRMKEQFHKYGKGKLTVLHEQSYVVTNGGWLKENPFGVRSDWERHVLDRGAPMYRLMLRKSNSSERSDCS
ncbi:uncharacterized protein LOC126617730 isoform X2 [Malus sylvestris]|uniref:uncharacterized protein LOC126617730 isoform X2 n=1 Tax=Malus sylvestris TaxID=3752 RepID=UPI0021AC4C73|nr:uncharacterized protein LOC126617730 isoform X2 [Malus sylvestris]